MLKFMSFALVSAIVGTSFRNLTSHMSDGERLKYAFILIAGGAILAVVFIGIMAGPEIQKIIAESE